MTTEEFLLQIIIGGLVLLIVIFSWRADRLRTIKEYNLLSRVKDEFRKQQSLSTTLNNTMEIMVQSLPYVKCSILILHGKYTERTKMRVIRNIQLTEKQLNRIAQVVQKRFIHSQEISLTASSIGLQNRTIPRFSFFPITLHNQNIGFVGVGYNRKRLQKMSSLFLKVFVNELSLEMEDRLLQKNVTNHSNGFSLVEYSYEHVIDSLPIGVVAIDTDRQILFINSAMKNLCEEKDPISIDYVDLFRIKEQKDEILEFIRELEQTRVITTIESFRYSVKGKKKYLQILGYPIFDSQNQIIAYIIMHINITQRYLLSEKLAKTEQKAKKELQEKVKVATHEISSANKELMRLNKLKSEFVSTISHELKTPLTSITGYVKLMLSERLGKVNTKQKGSLKIVAEESDRLAALISDVLDLSKLESGKTTLNLEKVAINQLLKKANMVVKQHAKEKQIFIECKRCTKRIELFVDPGKMSQVFINLIGNAIKFSNARGKVITEIVDRRQAVDISIIDRGIGISKKHLKNLFEPFYQVEEHLTRNASGSGLGLTISKHVVELHKGTIKVESEIGKGTKVTVTIPKNLEKELGK